MNGIDITISRSPRATLFFKCVKLGLSCYWP